MGMVVIGAVFVDIKGYPTSAFIPTGRNAGRVEQIHGGVGRNVAEDIANCELRPTFVSLVDDSGTGADVVRKLKSHRVNTDYIRKTRNGMGTWLAVFNDDGDVAASISQRPDLLPIAHTLEQDGDEIFRNADSVVIEIDMDKEIVKRTFRLAQKYGKPVYAVVANMSIALERRDFLQSTDCFVCNQQEAGILFSDDYSGKTPAEMIPIISAKVQAAHIPAMIVTMGADGAVYAGLPRVKAQRYAAQMLLGMAKLALASDEHTGALKDAVCSPGGTTIRAVAQLEKYGMRSAVIEAIRSCVDAAGK